jgi:hypothetical protein
MPASAITKRRRRRDPGDGRNWARTSDLQLVESKAGEAETSLKAQQQAENQLVGGDWVSGQIGRIRRGLGSENGSAARLAAFDDSQASTSSANGETGGRGGNAGLTGSATGSRRGFAVRPDLRRELRVEPVAGLHEIHFTPTFDPRWKRRGMAGGGGLRLEGRETVGVALCKEKQCQTSAFRGPE